MNYVVISMICAALFAGTFYIKVDPKRRRYILGAIAVAWVIMTVKLSVLMVSPGNVAVADMFGKVQSQTYGEGLHAIFPTTTTRPDDDPATESPFLVGVA